MKNLKRFQLLFIVMLNLFCTSIYAMDKYSAVALPENFGIGIKAEQEHNKIYWNNFNKKIQHSLNNHGQVAGYVGDLEMVPDCAFRGRSREKIILPDKLILINERAAIWDAKKGVKICPLSGDRSFATAINDSGWVTISGEQGSSVILWNSNTNELKDGPKGIPLAINNNGIVLIQGTLGYFSWNSKNNVITKIDENMPLTGLTNDGIPCLEIPSERDEFYSKNYLCFNWSDGNLKWFYDNKYHFLSAQPLSAILDYKNNVVVAVEDFKIVKWYKNGKKTISAESYEPSGSYASYCIGGFASSGNILLNSGEFGHCVLLTPLVNKKAPAPLAKKKSPTLLTKKKAPTSLIKKKASKALKVVKHKHRK